MKYDVIVIGAGIVGLATAYQILKRNGRLRVMVIDKENKVAAHQTGHNSGVIHSGIYYKPGSLKAQNCMRGYHMMLDFLRAHGIKHEICGKIILAVEDEELPRLEELRRRGEANGLTGLRYLNPEEIREIEPNARGVRALHVPQTGIVNFGEVAEKLRQLIEQMEGEIRLGEEVVSLQHSGEGCEIQSKSATYECRHLVNCSGLQNDRIAQLAGISLNHRIIPFRGEYYKLRDDRPKPIRNPIYPVPNPELPFLGVHVTKMISGEIEAGPNAFLAFDRENYGPMRIRSRDTLETLTWPGFYSMASKYWRVAIDELTRTFSKRAFINACRRLVPSIQAEDFVHAGCGIRAQAIDRNGKLVDDFVLIQNDHSTHVCNAPSPAATSSLSIGDTLAEGIVRKFERQATIACGQAP